MVELEPSLSVDGLLEVVLQDFLDDLLHGMLTEIVQKSGVWHTIRKFRYGSGSLRYRKVRLVHRTRFSNRCSLLSYVVVNVPSEDLRCVRVMSLALHRP